MIFIKEFINFNDDYNNIYNVYFVNKKIDHIYNRCEICFSLKNKLFKYLRSLCSKQNSIKDLLKIINNLLKMIFNKFITFIINNVYIEIIKFIIKLHYNIKFDYNFKS